MSEAKPIERFGALNVDPGTAAEGQTQDYKAQHKQGSRGGVPPGPSVQLIVCQGSSVAHQTNIGIRWVRL